MREARLPRIDAKERKRLAKAKADRLKPALAVLAERRADHAARRVKRWQAKHGRDLSLAPGHIKAMSRERKAKVA